MLRRVFLVACPLALAVVLWFHPPGGDDIYEGVRDDVDAWLVVHTVFLFFIPLIAFAAYLLLTGLTSRSATVSRASLVLFLVFYTAYEVTVGLVVGLLVDYANGLPAAEQVVVADAIQDYSYNWIVGDPMSVALALGLLGWVVAMIAAAIALRRAGVGWTATVLVGLTAVFAIHPPPVGPAGLVCFAVAAVLVERWRARSVEKPLYRPTRGGRRGCPLVARSFGPVFERDSRRATWYETPVPRGARMARVAWSVTVEAPVRAVYDTWTQFEEFPSFMTGVERVEQLDDTHLRWHVDIAGRRASFDAEVTEQIPDARVAWKSLTEPSHSGAVDFHRLDDEVTEIDVMMDVSEEALPGESAGGDSVASRRFEQVVKADLVRFKHLVESSEPASGWRGEVRPEGSGESASIVERVMSSSRMPSIRRLAYVLAGTAVLVAILGLVFRAAR